MQFGKKAVGDNNGQTSGGGDEPWLQITKSEGIVGIMETRELAPAGKNGCRGAGSDLEIHAG